MTKNTENQTKLPIKSLEIFGKTFIEGFWRKPSEGGFLKNKHARKFIVEDEEIIVSRTMNADYGKPGFKIVTKTRSSHILTTMPQSMQVTDELVKNTLLPLFER